MDILTEFGHLKNKKMKKYYTILIALLAVNGAFGQWTKQYTLPQRDFHSVFFTDANTGYVAGDSGILLKTENGGKLWTVLPSGTTKNLNSVFFTDANTGYVAGGQQYGPGIILKTTNGGASWTKVSNGISFALFSVYFTDANTGYAVGDSSSILKTINGGTTWIAGWTGIPETTVFTSVCFPDANNGYVVGYTTIIVPNGAIMLSQLFTTGDGGTIWGDVQVGSYGPLNSVYCPDVNTCYAVGGNLPYRPTYSEVVKMTHGTDDITVQISRENFSLNSVFFTDDNTGYAVGISGTILKTTNGGADWTSQNSGTNNGFSSVFFTDANTGYVVGGGIILKTTNGGNSLGISNSSLTESTLKIHPNPATSQITIETSAIRSPEQLLISNLGGQQVFEQRITEPTTTIDISKLPGGVYCVRLTGESKVQVAKFIKQ